MEEDLYELMGIAPESDGSIIKRRYRQLAQELHPDRTGGDQEKTERFQKVSIAYAILSNEQKRAAYDRERSSAASKRSGYSKLFGEDFDDLIERINKEGFSIDLLDDFLTYGQRFHKEAPDRMRDLAREKTEQARRSGGKVSEMMDMLEDLFGIEDSRPSRKR